MIPTLVLRCGSGELRDEWGWVAAVHLGAGSSATGLFPCIALVLVQFCFRFLHSGSVPFCFPYFGAHKR